MHAPSYRPRLDPRVLRAAGLGLLLLVSGCDWRTPVALKDAPGVLDLTDFGADLDGWRCSPADQGRLPPLRLDSLPHDTMLVVEARDGVPSRWRRKVRWDAESHPVLTWTWSPGRVVDSTGYVRRRSPSAVMALDVTLASTFGFPKTVRYVWSARKDRGAVWADRDNFHPKVVVLRDARDPSDSVVAERVDVWADFERLWGFRPRHQALALVVSARDPDAGASIQARFGHVFAHPIPETP